MTRTTANSLTGREWAILLSIAFVLAGFATLWGPITTPLVDPFHEGEYLSTRMLLIPDMPAPLLIHGSMDYVPANLAALLFGSGHLIAGTRFVNLVFAQLAAFAFFGSLLTLARNRGESLAVMLIGMVILFWINERSQTIVLLQQGSPATRDFPLMAALWALLAAASSAGTKSDRLAGLGALIAGCGWAWAYSRGVIMLAAVPTYALGAFLTGKPRHHQIWLFGGLGLGLAFNALLEPDMWLQHFRNALYWQHNKSIWSGPVLLSLIVRNMPFYLMGAVVGAAGAWALLGCFRDRERRGSVTALLVLGLVAAGNYFAMFNRPDPPYLMFAVPWLALLMVAAWLALSPAAVSDSWRGVVFKQAPLLAVIGAVLIVDVSAMTGSGTTRPVLQGLGRNLVTLVRGLPHDGAILDPRAAKVAAALAAGGSRCTYVFDNSGAFYYLSGLRSCSSIMLPIYANAGNEAQIIADLERSAPPLVVGRSNYWTDHIDDRSVAERTPTLNRWFEDHYAVEQIIDGIELRRLRPLQNSGASTGHARNQ